MYKKISLVIVFVFFLCAIFFGQTAKPSWSEMKQFHYFMSNTFHPSEEGNFKPLKEKADSMLAAAKNWKASAIPQNYKPKETKKALKQLVKVCNTIKTAVANNATDEVLKTQIVKAHDVFHTIVKECKKEDETH